MTCPHDDCVLNRSALGSWLQRGYGSESRGAIPPPLSHRNISFVYITFQYRRSAEDGEEYRGGAISLLGDHTGANVKFAHCWFAMNSATVSATVIVV
jgi:hypothetical protein